jgi:hypothetical protein
MQAHFEEWGEDPVSAPPGSFWTYLETDEMPVFRRIKLDGNWQLLEFPELTRPGYYVLDNYGAKKLQKLPTEAERQLVERKIAEISFDEGKTAPIELPSGEWDFFRITAGTKVWVKSKNGEQFKVRAMIVSR